MSKGQSPQSRPGRDFRIAARPSERPDHPDSACGPWRTNQNQCVDSAGGPQQEDAEREIPLPIEAARTFLEEYGELANLPLTRQNGRSLRPELTRTRVETHRESALSDQLPDGTFHGRDEPPEDWLNGFEVSEVTQRNPVTWGEAVVRLCRDHEENRKTTLHLARGKPGEAGYATFDVDAESRFMASYQKKYFAQMKGWFREVLGIGERPSGEEPSGLWDDGSLILLTRTASSTPDGDRLAPVDHFDALSGSWRSCYDTLRNTMDDLGCDWQYDRRLEPHPGDGPNECYPHEHVVLLVDGEVSPSDLRPVIETHVEECEPAGPYAHDLDVEDWDCNRSDVDTVEIRDPEDIDNLAAYVADYCSIEPVDLLEREPDYLAFAAAAWATSTNTISRSDAASYASKADACRQQFEHPQADQNVDHGEEISGKRIRGTIVPVCAECGSPHGIDAETLSAARLEDDGDQSVVADGGHSREIERDLDREDDLRDRWPSARAAASAGETNTRRKIRQAVERELERNPDADRNDLLVAGAEAGHRHNAAIEAEGRHPKGVHGIRVESEMVKEVVGEVLDGYDPCERTVGFERAPSWCLEAISIEDERHEVGSSGGMEMADTQLGGEHLSRWVLDNTCLGEISGSAANLTKWGRVTVGLRSVARIVGYRAGCDVERCETLIEAFVTTCTDHGGSAPDSLVRACQEEPPSAP